MSAFLRALGDDLVPRVHELTDEQAAIVVAAQLSDERVVLMDGPANVVHRQVLTVAGALFQPLPHIFLALDLPHSKRWAVEMEPKPGDHGAWELAHVRAHDGLDEAHRLLNERLHHASRGRDIPSPDSKATTTATREEAAGLYGLCALRDLFELRSPAPKVGALIALIDAAWHHLRLVSNQVDRAFFPALARAVELEAAHRAA